VKCEQYKKINHIGGPHSSCPKQLPPLRTPGRADASTDHTVTAAALGMQQLAVTSVSC